MPIWVRITFVNNYELSWPRFSIFFFSIEYQQYPTKLCICSVCATFFELYKNVCTVKMNDVPEVMSLCKEAELYRNFY